VLAPGEARAFDLALIFATGEDHLNSVTVLKETSDFVQGRYDAGTLFAPSPLAFPPPGGLAAPNLIAPEDDAVLIGGEPVVMTWGAVPGAETYRLETATAPDFSDGAVRY